MLRPKDGRFHTPSLHPDKTAIPGERTYTRSDLLTQYQLLAVRQLSINGLSQLVSVVEAMLEDVIRFVVVRHPKKLGSKKQISLQAILEAATLEEIHSRAVDALLNELAYEAPSEFAKAFESLIGVKLLECPAFHRYIELKASRDVFIHNRGIANAIYKRKSGSHARVNVGANMPCDTSYFLESYEACLQLSEWLESELHEIWPSTELEQRKTAQFELQLPQAKHDPRPTEERPGKSSSISRPGVRKKPAKRKNQRD